MSQEDNNKDLSSFDEQVAFRNKNLENWRSAGIDPYGQGFSTTHSATEIKEACAELQSGEEDRWSHMLAACSVAAIWGKLLS